jgi:hypothetical protein
MVVNGQLEPNWSRAGIYAGSLNFRVEFLSGGEAQYNHLRPVRGYQVGGPHPEYLDLVPMVTTRYSTWKAMFPNTNLWCDSTKTGTPTSYQRKGGDWVYIGCNGCDLIYFNENTFTPTSFVSNNVISPNEATYTKKIAVVHDKGIQWSIVFIRENVGGNAELNFAMDNTTGTPFSMKDVETGSTWDLTGKCTAGPLSGQQLEWYHHFYRANQTVYNGYDGHSLYQSSEMRELVVKTATAVVSGPAGKNRTAELNVFPNPFHPRTSVTCFIPAEYRDRTSSLRIYTPKGEMIKSIPVAAGSHTVQWSGTANPGLYLLKLKAGREQLTKRVMLLE